MVWITTDTHLNHDNIVIYENRPANFKDLIIENWMASVKPDDTVIHLGDVIFKRRYELKSILESLPGIKILVKGNHDNRTGTDAWFLRNGFNYVSKTYELRGILFSHKPLDMSLYPGMRHNVHGHLHSNSHEISDYPFYDPAVHVRVSIEEHDYKMIQLADLVSL